MGVIMPRKSDKRERLIQAAKDLMFRQGFNLTTLADIAQEADVPLGNVYYYFKTKESIGDAVIAHCISELNQRLADYDALGTAKERLNAYLNWELNELEWTMKYGDRFGTLCQELAKQGGPLANNSSNLLLNAINWLQKQFVELGCSQENAATKAIELMAKLQGHNLIAVTFKTRDRVDMLKSWLRDEINVSSSVTTTHAEERIEAFA